HVLVAAIRDELGLGADARPHSHNAYKRGGYVSVVHSDVTMPQSQPRTVSFVEVSLVPWPGADERRVTLRDAGMPRLLLVPEDCDPPLTDDVLEDWVRTPADPRQVQAR